MSSRQRARRQAQQDAPQTGRVGGWIGWRLGLALVGLAFGAQVSACGGSASDAADQDQQALIAAQAASPEVTEVAQALTGLESRADALVNNVQALEQLVLGAATVQDADALLSAGGALFIEVDANDVIRLNGAGTSVPELVRYIQAQGKAVCQPQPTIVMDPKAKYDLIAGVLEAIYGQSCGEVNIVQQNPARLRGRAQ